LGGGGGQEGEETVWQSGGGERHHSASGSNSQSMFGFESLNDFSLPTIEEGGGTDNGTIRQQGRHLNHSCQAGGVERAEARRRGRQRREEEEEQSRIRVALSHSLIGYNKWLRYTSMVFYAHCQVVFLA
jgi:hypothetical protein